MRSRTKISLAILATASHLIGGCRRATLEPHAAAAASGTTREPAAAHADVRAALARPHPRVLLTPERVAVIAERARMGDADWRAVEARANDLSSYPVAPFARQGMPARTISYAYQGFGWLNAAVPLGLAYQVTRDLRYARKLQELLTRINATTAAGDLSPVSLDAGYPSRTAALAVAVAFDWAHAALDEPTRRETVESINRWFDWNRARAFERDGPGYGNYFGGHLLGFAALGFASLGDNARAPELIAHTDRSFDTHVRPAFRDGGFAGGFPVEGYVYGANHFVRLFQYLDLVRTATGRTPRELHDWAARCARNLIHNVKPNRWQVPDEASYAGDTTGLLGDELPRMLAFVLGDGDEAAALGGLLAARATIGKPPAALPKDELAPAMRLLFPARRASGSAAALPTVLHSPGDERIVVRSGWDDRAVWASINGGMSVFAGHQAKTAGHLAIQRGSDYLLVYAGQWKGPDGVSGQPQLDVLTSDAANTLFVEDGGRYLTTGEGYRGGQGPFARTRDYAWAAARELAWARLELADAYDRRADRRDVGARTVRRYARDFAWIAPGSFVLLDRVETARADDRKHVRFHFHHDGRPTIEGRHVTSAVGGSKLALDVLLPTEPELATAWMAARGTPLVPRLELGARQASERLDVLVVVQALPRDGHPAATLLVRSDDGVMIGARLDERLTSHIVLFAARADDDKPAPSLIRYEAHPTLPTRHLVVALPPAARYRARVAGASVTLARSEDGAFVVDANGVLRFEAIAGSARPLPPTDAGRVVSSAP